MSFPVRAESAGGGRGVRDADGSPPPRGGAPEGVASPGPLPL